MTGTSFVAIDVETTDLPHKDDYSYVYITEIAGVEVRDGEIQRVWHSLVRLPDEADYPEETQRLTGITREACQRHGVDIRQALSLLSPAASIQIVGHNLYGFDLPIIHEAYARCGMSLEVNCWIHDFEPLDTMLLWRAHKLGLKRRPWEPVPVLMGRVQHLGYWGGSSLRHVADELGIREDERGEHRAADDAWTCAQVLLAMRAEGILEEVLGDE